MVIFYVGYEKGEDYGDRFWVRWDEMEGQEMDGRMETIMSVFKRKHKLMRRSLIEWSI